MFEKGLKELENISQGVGNRKDYVQGGGGNTSVKLDDRRMAVKASGYKLNQITPSQGFVIIDYKNIKDYYDKVDINQDIDFERESVEVAKKNIFELEGLKVLRPSVEAGFHSIMKEIVIHTHPVYINIFCCSKEGSILVDKIFKDRSYAYLWIPYINPGFCLTLKIKEEIDRCISEDEVFPEVIFMENHGLIITAHNYQRALELHEEVNNLARQYLRLNKDYPNIELVKLAEDLFLSKTRYLVDFFSKNNIDLNFFQNNVLYPDQQVYLNNSLSIDGPENKLNINTKTGELLYKTNYSEALTIEETLLGYIYVMDNVMKCGLELKVMSEREINFIKNWESETYRKSLVKDLTK